ncbi:hypothetical protein L873DRAFT_1425223 [Choiromyces venosus 120613-1]|uniref:Uncharacterized protein n=1 Tax=Choiromyces venosus 120613-1 TaxID=1336337 RepID=A0A3N4J884_9PEZI|nr:hypothetical protein L873DRAFT_1425223 [Choiromyces venosus 120613-1]
MIFGGGKKSGPPLKLELQVMPDEYHKNSNNWMSHRAVNLSSSTKSSATSISTLTFSTTSVSTLPPSTSYSTCPSTSRSLSTSSFTSPSSSCATSTSSSSSSSSPARLNPDYLVTTLIIFYNMYWPIRNPSHLPLPLPASSL